MRRKKVSFLRALLLLMTLGEESLHSLVLSQRMFLSLQNFTLKIDPHAYLLVILSGQPRNTKTCKFYLFASLL